ncbi:MAG: hypothetical protein B6U97_02145 [Candidatus Altiarchaeales archaeon ex4484_96]|nr:MAG: hypothetical protein B6U97_02145 [Candidatus Altiarchaeales archaeon ex4484_96]
MEKDKVLIGEYIGTIEEFVPGKGTFAEDGKIYSAIIGEVELDKANQTVRVKGKTIPELEVGQVVFGEIVNIRRNNITVIVKRIRGFDLEMDEKTSLYVSNIADKYVEKAEDLFGIGDIIEGEIIRIHGGMVSLTTKGGYGVVLAFCKRCRHRLEKTDKYKDKLICPNCAHEEKRKIAADYGNVKDV